MENVLTTEESQNFNKNWNCKRDFKMSKIPD